MRRKKLLTVVYYLLIYQVYASSIDNVDDDMVFPRTQGMFGYSGDSKWVI